MQKGFSLSCDRVLTDAEIVSIYNIKQEKLKASVVYKDCRGGGSDAQKYVRIEVSTANDVLVERPVEREYFEQAKLLSKTGYGKVAKHYLFRLKESYKQHGIGKELHANEFTLYKLREFDEIQLKAAWDGLVVWRRLHFRFINQDVEKSLLRKLQAYLIEIKGYSKSEVATILDKKQSIASIHSDYLIDSVKLHFTDWLTQKALESDIIMVEEMVKEVA